MRTNFEERIKEAADNHKVEYNPQHWNELEEKLNKLNTASPRKNYLLKSAAMLAVILAGSSLIYFLTNEKEIPSVQPANALKITNQPLPETNKISEPVISESEVIEPEKKIIIVKNSGNEFKKAETKVLPPKEEQEELAASGNEENAETNQMIAAEVWISRTEICEGETVSFEVQNLQSDYDYSWKIENKIFTGSRFESPKLSSGTYPVILTSLSPQNQRNQKTYQVKVNPKPVAAFNWKEAPSSNASKAILFNDVSEGATEWEWSFGDNEISSLPNTTHDYAAAGNYQVQLTAKNAKGCTSTISQMITVKDINPLLAPNAFSPDGDGINETFIPRKLEIIDIPFELTIFDRSGNIVYKTTDKTKPWNGRMENSGEILQGGSTFVWIVTTKDDRGKEQRYQGVVGIVK